MSEYSPEMMALAREIVNQFIWTPEDGDLSKRTGPQQPSARDMERAVLSAIQQTTELAAKLASGDMYTHEDCHVAEDIANALRIFDHLKGQADADS